MHNFHIPVLGLAFSIDTPLKVARYGIASVVSVVDDELIERMREYHCLQNGHAFSPIAKKLPDSRALRITAYLNYINTLVSHQLKVLKSQPFKPGQDIVRYFELLPETSALKIKYHEMLACTDTRRQYMLQQSLRTKICAGSIDVNIMAKVDKLNYDAKGRYTGDANTDALAALRGFAQSNLNAGVVLSAGMNPRLYSYLENFPGFYPDKKGNVRKKVILKVSDCRSAFIQAKFLAKKGIWVHEFRIESGLNCGGHAFATDGLLLGPILEEFKQKKQQMHAELVQMYTTALNARQYDNVNIPPLRITVQGGIGTVAENSFLLNYYGLDATGWGSPFLLVPEATNVDDETLQNMAVATTDDYYLSAASPLGVLFNNFRKSTAEIQRQQRVKAGRPGSPCTKKYLCNNTEFTETPICTASRQYQHLKLSQLNNSGLSLSAIDEQTVLVTEKVCLCEGLCASVYIKNNMLKPRENKAVSVCPGPNLAYFSRSYTLDEMVGHIYGRTNLLSNVQRPHMFINELNLYIDYLQKETQRHAGHPDDKKHKYLLKFKQELVRGIEYYKQLIPDVASEKMPGRTDTYIQLLHCEEKLNAILLN